MSELPPQIAHADPGGGYEWHAFDVRQDENGVFWWSAQNGCSCNEFEYDVHMYQRGDKLQLLTAITQWGGGSYGSLIDVARLIEQVATHQK